MIADDASEQIADLLAVLDAELALIEDKHERLGELSEAMIARDEPAVEAVLDRLEQAEREQAEVDGRLSELRAALAGRLGRPADELRLSTLAELLPPPEGEAVRDRRERIVAAAERLQQRHLRTALLLSECARVNRMLLEGLCPSGAAVTTYAAGGERVWRQGSGLLDTEL